MKTPLLILIALLFTACSTSQPYLSHDIEPNCSYYSLKTALCQNETQMITNLHPYKVIFIGDHHTEDNLHQNIAKLITAFSKNGTKVILANEWFYPSDNETLDRYCANEDNETQFIEHIQWKKRMKWYKYTSFKPLYQAVKENGGELRGINLSQQERKRISDQNLSHMTQDEGIFYDSLDLNVTPHKNLVMPFLSHCHAPKKNESLKECSERMYKVQVAWDSKMALESYKLSQNLKANEKLLVFAGSMHIENALGIPLRFSRLSNLPSVSIIPMNKKNHNVKHGIGDFILFYNEVSTKGI